jgi:hypothetical protein
MSYGTPDGSVAATQYFATYKLAAANGTKCGQELATARAAHQEAEE